MKKLSDNTRFSIKIKIFILIVSIILFISSSLVLFFIIRSKGELEKEVEKRGVLEMKSLVLDVEYTVLTKNLTSLENILKSRLQKPDIVYLEVKGNNDKVLAIQKKSEYGVFFKTNESRDYLGEDVYRSFLSSSSKANVRFYEFIAPILTERLATNEYENELDLIMMGQKEKEKQYLPSKIGTVKLAISLEKMDKQMSNFLFGSVFIVFIVVIISILISIFFTNMIVAPIRNVALTAKEISEGNFEKRVEVKTTDETGILAMNFNKMASSLKSTVGNLKREIHEKNMMEDALRSTKNQLQEIIDNTTAIIYLKDIQGKYLLINKRYEKLFYINKKEIIGKTDYDIFPKDTAEIFKKHDVEVINTNAPIEAEEFVTHDGELHSYISVKFPVYDASGVLYGVCGISTDITERKKIEKEILEIEENERNRIGSDLHDSIGQLLAVISLKSQVLQKGLNMKALEKESKQAKEIIELTNSTIKHTRMLVKGISPLNEDKDNLCDMLEELVFSMESIFNISCTFECDKNDLSFDYSVKTNIYRITQEAINNAIKHANPQNIRVNIFSKNGNTIFQVKDDGNGIGNSLNLKKGMGLRTMRYRANLIGASLNIRKDINGGTIVDCGLKRISNEIPG